MPASPFRRNSWCQCLLLRPNTSPSLSAELNKANTSQIEDQQQSLLHPSSWPCSSFIGRHFDPLSSTSAFISEIAEKSGDILNKRAYKIGDKELRVLVANSSGKTTVHLATDLPEPVNLHWALSKKSGEWLAPPPNLLLLGSVSLDKAVETQFSSSSFGDLTIKVQSLEIEIEESSFVGMPIVLLSGGNWIKDSGSDFYIGFAGPKEASKQDTGDAKGTAKILLDRIAEMESTALVSWFLHRRS